jgi:hypothetical protein
MPKITSKEESTQHIMCLRSVKRQVSATKYASGEQSQQFVLRNMRNLFCDICGLNTNLFTKHYFHYFS